MTINVENIVGRCTLEESRDLSLAVLEAMPNDEAIAVIKSWADRNGLNDELEEHFGSPGTVSFEAPLAIIVQSGHFADGMSSPTYQLYEWVPRSGTYRVMNGHGPNDPVHLATAQERLKALVG